MKTFICLIFAMIILNGHVFANANYIPDDVADTEYKNAYEILTGLSIFDYNDDSSFRPFTPITRGEFSVALGNIMKDLASDGNMYFYDVPKNHEAFEAVSKLTGYGVINGVGPGEFYPDENIQAASATKMLVLAMGYYHEAESLGGYPDGYMRTAQSIGLLKGVRFESNGELLRGEAAKMLLNSLELPVVSAYFSDKYEMKINRDEDFMYAAMGIKKIKGILNANHTYSVDGNPEAPEDSLRIDDDIYYCSESEWTDMVGYNVTCYFSEDDYYGGNKVVYLYKNTSRTREIKVLAKNADSFEFPKFQYQDEHSSRLRKLTVSDNLCMVYNGKVKQSIDKTDFRPANGELNFIDSDNDGKYDVVKIKTYTNALVSAVREDEIYISCPVNGKIKMDDYDTVTIYNKDGNEVSHSELKENDVISVYESADKSIASIVYSRDRITGTVTDSYEDDGLKHLVIDGVSYDVAFDYDQSFPNLTSIGTKGTFCLDANGDIYSMTGDKSNTRRYGYIIKAWEKDEDETFCVRVLEESGKLVNRILSNKIEVDGDGSRKAGGAYSLIAGVIPSPVVYKTNQKGEITMIDTVSENKCNDNDRLKLVKKSVTGMYRSRTMSFNFVLPIDASTKFFIIPDDPNTADDNDYGCGDYRFLENETTYSKMDYYCASDKLTADIVVMKDKTSLTSVIGVVTNTTQTINLRGDITVCYTLQTGSGEASYAAAKESVANEIHKVKYGSEYSKTELIDPEKELRVGIGDLVLLYVNGAGEAEKVCIIYDTDAQTVYSDNPNTEDANVTSFQRYLFGEISEINKGIAAIARTSTNIEYYNLKGKSVYIYTDAKRKGGRIHRGMTEDLKPGDKILIISVGGIPQYAFAYGC